MKTPLLLSCVAILAVTAFLPAAGAKDGQVVLLTDGTNMFIQVMGDKDDDWRIQTPRACRGCAHRRHQSASRKTETP
jgi:hypothetical protein